MEAEDSPSRVRRIEELDRTVKSLEQRLAAVERHLELGPSATAPPPEEAARAESATTTARLSVPEELGYVGRTLLVMGGGYLLRALTESRTLPTALGLFLGVVYGLTWIVLAWRAAGAGRRHSGIAHGIAGVLVGFPMIWETTVRFGLLGPAGGSLLLSLYLLLLLAVSWHRELRVLAWVTVVGGLAASLATMLGTRSIAPFAAVLVLLGIGSLWTAWQREWTALPWFAAVGADLGVAILTFGLVAEQGGVSPLAALPVQLALALLYLGSFGLSALEEWHPVSLLTLAQSGLAVAIGLGGALLAVRSDPGLGPVLGVLTSAVAVGAYILAFRGVERSRRTTFHYLATLGMLFLLVGTGLLLPWPAGIWLLLAVVSAAAGRRFGRLSLSLHSGLFVLAAAGASGLFVDGALTFVAPAHQPWPDLGGGALLTVACAVLCLLIPEPTSPYRGPFRGGHRLPHLFVLAWGVGTLLLLLGSKVSGIRPGPEVDAGAVAVLRTAVLGLVAVALAVGGRFQLLEASRWLVYPALLAGGLKLLFEDFVQGRPGTLFLSLLLYGTALILAPKLQAKKGREQAEESSAGGTGHPESGSQGGTG